MAVDLTLTLVQDLRIEQILDGVTEDSLDPVTVAKCIRAAYGKGYVDGLEDPFPSIEKGRLTERRAWALLP